MKRTILNLGAILAAFVIGLAINNACADSLEKMSDSELRNLVAKLQEEVNSLKQKVSELESHSGSTGDCGYFVVDGIRFNAAGLLSEESFKRYSCTSTQTTTYDGQITNTTVRTFDDSNTKYDSKGRVISQITEGTESNTENSYVYNGNHVTATMKVSYLNQPLVVTVVNEYEFK